MHLLGNYPGNLSAFLYQELISQLETAISNGEFAGGALFDSDSAKKLQQQGQSFSDISIPTAGSVAFAEDINSVLNILIARYAAITNEILDFGKVVEDLLQLVDNESLLIDQIKASAEGRYWASRQSSLSSAEKFIWNFAAGYGLVPTEVPLVDPTNGVEYPSLANKSAIIIPTVDNVIRDGLLPPGNSTINKVKSLQWSYNINSDESQFEEVYDPDNGWTILRILEPKPLIQFGNPIVETILPIDAPTPAFAASGTPVNGLPIYVRQFFHPRQGLVTVTAATSNQKVDLSLYNVVVNTVQVYDSDLVYLLGIDYTLSDDGVLTVSSTGSLVGKTFSVLFTEYYPAYQCSINQSNWGPIIMLDPNKLYPDDVLSFDPILMNGDAFPVTDELGISTGLYITLAGIPTTESISKIVVPGSVTSGETATLTIDLETVSYINSLRLAPITNYPVTINSITAEGFTSDTQTNILNGPVLLNKDTIIRFDRQLVRRFIITLYQTDYSLKQYTVDPPDALRRNALIRSQSSLPFSVRRPHPAVPQNFEGAVYEAGFENIYALDFTPIANGVFVTGPYTIQGMPEVLRFDLEAINISNTPTNSIYLLSNGYNANDVLISTSEMSITPGTTIKYPVVTIADHVKFYVKFIFRNTNTVVEKIQLQVTTNVQ